MDLFFFSLVASQSPSSLPTLVIVSNLRRYLLDLFNDCVVISLKTGLLQNVKTGYLINTSLQYDMLS